MDQLAQWRAQDWNQFRDCGVATHKGPKLYSDYNGVEIESAQRVLVHLIGEGFESKLFVSIHFESKIM